MLAAMWYSYKTGIFLLFGMLHMAASITGQFYFLGQIFLEKSNITIVCIFKYTIGFFFLKKM